MAPVITLSTISLILLIGCYYIGVDAGKYHKGHHGKDRYQVANQLRKLKFSLVISGQRICRLQETLGWRLYKQRLYCDTGITVTDPTEDQIEPMFKTIFMETQRSGLDQPESLRPSIDNVTRSTAYSLTRKWFCGHRAILAASSKYLENLINNALGNQKSYAVRHVFIDLIDIPPDVFEYILQYIYTNQIDNFDPNLHIVDLFVASYLMQLTELRDSILDYILNEMVNSIEQMHRIINWLKWAQKNRNTGLERTLITMMKKVLKLESNTRWQDFGKILCEITQPTYLANLASQIEKSAPLLSKF